MIDIKIQSLMLHTNTWNHLAGCKEIINRK